MRQSPTKVNFNYPQSPIQPKMYSPRLIQSSFILGEPVALTNQPQLPPHYPSFSPKISRPRAFTQIIHNSRHSFYEPPEPSHFAPPTPRNSLPSSTPRYTQTIAKQQYMKLLHNYHLETRYLQLQSRKQVSSQSYSQKQIVTLIQKYKTHLLDQCKLLVDRTRRQYDQSSMRVL